MQLERIAIATDLSEPAAITAEWVARHFAPNAELARVHVIDPGGARHPSSDAARTVLSVEGERNRASRRLHELAAAFGAARCTVDVRIGRPVDEVIHAVG